MFERVKMVLTMKPEGDHKKLSSQRSVKGLSSSFVFGLVKIVLMSRYKKRGLTWSWNDGSS